MEFEANNKKNILNIGKQSDINIYKYNLALFLRAILLLNPIILLFYQENGLSVKELFFFQCLFYLTSVVSEIPIGYIADRIPKKYVLVSAYVLFICVFFMWLVFNGYFIIMLGEIMMGIAKVMTDNVQSGWLYDYLKNKNKEGKMPKLLGYLYFFLSGGTAVASIIGTWLYVHFGSHLTITLELFIMLLGLILITTLPNVYIPNKTNASLKLKIKKFNHVFIAITKNKSIMGHLCYSAFLTSFSIVFALCFQPLMQTALIPVAFFGMIALINHGTRAIFSGITGKISKIIKIRNMVIPLYILYLIAFGCIFTIFGSRSKILVLSLLVVICLIIGFQLVYTIMQISRLHKFVSSKYRGTIISLNNLISRSMTFVILLFSKIFINKIGLQNYIMFLFFVFLIIGGFLMITTKRIREND